MNDSRQCCVLQQHVGLEADAAKDAPHEACDDASSTIDPQTFLSDRSDLDRRVTPTRATTLESAAAAGSAMPLTR